MTNVLFPLILAGVGLPVVVSAVLLVARHLVYKHADAYAAEVRRAAEAHQAAEYRAAVDRIIADARAKEMAR